MSLERSRFSLVDDVGDLFIDEQKLYRAINSDCVSDVQELMRSGLIQELVAKRLFPETNISSKQIPGYDLVLEHRKIAPSVLPFEWSPEMLRYAALKILEVSEVCSRYGYELKDAHAYNMMYDFNRCLFVDFGSIQKKSTDNCSSFFVEEFTKSYYYPLYLYSKGAEYFYATCFLKQGGLIPHFDFFTYKYKSSRLIPANLLKKLLRFFWHYKKVYSVDESSIRNKFPSFLANLLIFMRNKKLLPKISSSHSALRKKISKLNLNNKTEWGDYHVKAGMMTDSGEIKLSKRMKTVLDLVRKYKPDSVLELAGNQGVLSREIAKIDAVERVICSDYDYKAIDVLHDSLKSLSKCKVLPCVINFMLPSYAGLFSPPDTRLRSKMVIALAVTHHLILTQNFKLEKIVERFYDFTDKYLIVEFMPLGLFDGVSAPPIPSWYKKEWFVKGLSEKFNVLYENKVEENRIIFMAEKIQ